MFKRILLALALAASLGGGILACNTPAGSTSPTLAPSTAPVSTPAASDAAPSVEPSAS
jgi:hypothetical protein